MTYDDNTKIGKHIHSCSESADEFKKYLLIALFTVLLILLVIVCCIGKCYYVHLKTRTPVKDLEILQDKEIRDELYSI